jgi:hypothetical protein
LPHFGLKKGLGCGKNVGKEIFWRRKREITTLVPQLRQRSKKLLFEPPLSDENKKKAVSQLDEIMKEKGCTIR